MCASLEYMLRYKGKRHFSTIDHHHTEEFKNLRNLKSSYEIKLSAHGLYAKNYYCKQYSECNQCIKKSSNNVVYTLSGLLTRSDSMRMLMQCIHSLHAARFDTS